MRATLEAQKTLQSGGSGGSVETDVDFASDEIAPKTGARARRRPEAVETCRSLAAADVHRATRLETRDHSRTERLIICFQFRCQSRSADFTILPQTRTVLLREGHGEAATARNSRAAESCCLTMPVSPPIRVVCWAARRCGRYRLAIATPPSRQSVAALCRSRLRRSASATGTPTQARRSGDELRRSRPTLAMSASRPWSPKAPR